MEISVYYLVLYKRCGHTFTFLFVCIVCGCTDVDFERYGRMTIDTKLN